MLLSKPYVKKHACAWVTFYKTYEHILTQLCVFHLLKVRMINCNILKNRFLLVFFLFFLSRLVSGQEYLLKGRIHLRSQYWKQIRYMVASENGSQLLAGIFEKELEMDGVVLKTRGKQSLFLASMDSSNKVNWIKNFNCTGYLGVDAIHVNDEGTFTMTGWFYDSLQLGNQVLTSPGHKELFVCKFDKSGNPVESEIILQELQGNILTSIIKPDGNLMLAGIFRKKLKVGSEEFESKGGTDIIVIQANSHNEILNSFAFGGTGDDNIQGLLWENHKFLLYGTFEKEMPVGDTLLKSSGKKDVFLASMDSVLNYSGALSIGGRLNDEIKAVTADNMGNYYLTGTYKRSVKLDQATYSSRGETDIFLAKFDADFKYIFKNSWGGRGHDMPTGIYVNKRNQIFLTGIFNRNINFGLDTLTNDKRFSDGFLTMIDPAGSVNWVKQLSGNSEEIPQKIFPDGDDGILVTGSFYDEIKFGENKWTTQESSDAFVFKYLDPCSLLKFDLPAEKAICNDDKVLLSAGAGYTNYNWNDGFAFSESIEIADTGLWKVEIRDLYGCKAVDTIHVIKDSLFVDYTVKDEMLPEGYNGSIELNYGGGKPPYNILWSDFQQAEKREGLSKGFYQVTITDANACEITRKIEVGQMVAAGILDINAFPNPIDDLTHIFYAIPENTRIQISLYDFAGRRLLTLFSGKKRKGEYGFDWRANLLKEGVYYLQIQTPRGIVSKKIIINPDH